MAEVFTFDVVPENVAQFIGGAPFSTNTRPTYVETEAIIRRHAAVWCAFISGMGITPSVWAALPDSALYLMSQQYILNKTAAQVARARDRNAQELADQFIREADQIRDEVREHPQSYGEARPTGASAPNIPYSAPATEPARWSELSRAQGTLSRNALVGRM